MSNVELTGLVKWVFVIFVLGGSCLIMIMGSLYSISWAYEKFMNRILKDIRASKWLLEYAYYRKEFKEWRKNKIKTNE